MYIYKFAGVSETDNRIYISCNEEDSINENEPFVDLVKHIVKKWNKNEWQGNISSVGDMRYKIQNDPLDLVYQWDDLIGIVFEYKSSRNIDDVKSFLADKYSIS